MRRVMQRALLLLLLLLLLTQSTACISAPLGNGSQVTTSITDPLPDLPNPLPPHLFPAWNTADETARQFLSSPDGIVDVSVREYSYADLREDLDLLAKLYPTRFSYRVFGQSVAERDLYVATLGNPNATKQILVSAGIHGREYLTPLLVMKQIEYYLAYYDVGDYNGFRYSALFDEYCFVIVPMTNPDGIMLAQEGIASISSSSLRNKINTIYNQDRAAGYTKQTDINEYLKIWKANANGVDLNRNFAARWDEIDTGMSRPSHKHYKGTSPASEPETRAMVTLTESLSNIKAVLCIHSQGEVLYWDCGQTGELRTETEHFTEMLSIRDGYKVIYKQNNDASYSDWCALEKGLIAVTVETGKSDEPGPLGIEQFPKIWTDNYDLFALATVNIKLHE